MSDVAFRRRGPAWRARVALLAALSLLPLSARSAEITSAPSQDDPNTVIVGVEGEIGLQDADRFAAAVGSYRKGLVVLSSPGGSVFAALRMGQVIRSRQFWTLVPDGARCASACALMWLGGTPRFLQPNGRVGFHAAYVREGGQTSETGVGNALIGAYLNRLGLPDKAIVYVELAHPDEITWLTPDDAREVGIDLSMLPSTQAASIARPVLPHASRPDTSGFIAPTFAPLGSVAKAMPPPPTVSSSSPVPGAPIPPAPSPPPLQQADLGPDARMRAFATDYFARWSEANGQALGYFASVYAPSIDFYGKPIARPALLGQKRDYAVRWPSRLYTVRPASLSVSCEPGGAACTVSGVVDWDCRSAERDARSVGAANFMLRVAFAGREPSIVAESGSVIARQAAQ